MVRSVLLGAAWMLAAAPAWAADGAAVENVRAMLLAKVGPACLAAKTPGDLETLALKLEQLPPATDPASQARQRGAIFLVSRWSDYLTALRAEDNAATVKALEDLIENTDWLSLMPRSPVLERYQQATETRWVDYPLDSLEDFDVAIVKLRDFQSKYGLSRDGVEKAKRLERLQGIRRRMADLPAAQVEAACRPELEDDPDVTTYKMMLLPLVAATYLDLPEGFRLPPKKGEVTFAYLQRLLDLAAKKGEMVVYWRVLAYRAGVLRDCPAWTTARLTALDKTLSGLKKEGDSQLMGALGDYLEALQQAGIPAQVAVSGEHARQIIETHPEVVDQLAATRQQEMVRSRMGFGDRFAPGNPRVMSGFPGDSGSSGPGNPPDSPLQNPDYWKKY
ncbi:hypothetical protein DB345_02380 [Spartobacteria bacterium LR76]|nr:hypothetical protein DB345_02380 [Spartobacteria bacterium LR76]